jgi:hypothetical protein
MSCELKTNFAVNPNNEFEGKNAQNAELNNNNLHIWELAKTFSKLAEKIEYGLWTQTANGASEAEDLDILAPGPVASIFSDTDAVTSDINSANVIAAFNGPMAHIYVKANDGWGGETPDYSNVENVAEVFRLLFQTNNQQEAASQFGLAMEDYYQIRKEVPRLNASIDTILVRQNGSYRVFNGIGAATGDLSFGSQYVDALNRITRMNNSKRSGDIVLIFKDSTTGNAGDRFTSGVACKSWHGSLSPSDSFVPLIISYPGGNKDLLETIKQKVCVNGGCEGNWALKDIVTEIFNEQYTGQ